MSSQAKKVQCSRFEPQTWRKTLCKNCFKTKNEHTEETSDERLTPDVMSDLALSPEVLSGDKIIVRRSLVTPPPMDVGDFVGLGRRGSDNSSGRRTPIREDITKSNTTSSGRSTPIAEVMERKVLDEQKSKDADVVSAKGATSGKQIPIVEEQKKGLSKEEGREEPNSKEADDKVLKAKATDIISAKITPVIDKSKEGTAAPTAKVVETSDLSGTEIAQSPQEARNHSSLYLNGDLPTQTNQPSDSPALTSITSPFKPAHVPPCLATATPAPPLSETTTSPTVSAPSGQKTPREVDIGAAAAGVSAKDSEGGSKEGKTSPSGRSELSSSAINNRDFRSPAVGLESEAVRTALLGAHAAPPPPQAALEGSEVDRQSSVHEHTSNECTPASIAPCRSDEKKAVEENKSSSTGTSIATSATPTPTSTSNSSSSNSGINLAGQTSDAQTKIAKAAPAAAAAAVDSGAARSSYVQSLRIHLTSPVNTEAAAAASGGGAVGVGGSSPDGETKNSYGIRHGGSSPAPAASNGPSLSAVPTKQDATGDAKFNAAAATAAVAAAAAAALGVAPIQLAKSSAGELRSQEISPQKTDDDDGAPNGLNASSVKAAVVVDPRSSSDSPSPPSLGRPKAEVSLSLNSGGGGFAPATAATNPFVNNNNNNNNNSNSNSVGSPTSGYQFVDVNDSRLSYSIIDEGGGAGGGGGGGGAGSKSSEGTFYYLTSGQEGTAAPANPPPFSPSSSEPPTPDQPKKKVTSLFHHVPGDSPGYPDEGQQSPNLRWNGNDSPVFRSQADDETAAANYSNLGGGGGGFDQAYQQQQQPGSGRRRRRSRVISVDDTNAAMSGFDYQRSDAMMEGTRMVIENLREKVAQMQDQCERLEREKVAVGDLLAAKKSDYELMKDHFSESISNLELEVQRLKSEKSRLLDKLQLPESERASLAAEENEIADLKRRLEEYENRYTEVVGENEDLKQEVRDLQLEMEEMHDQFREEETMEFRELQKELENTAKNCRILQFKLRKAERRTEQLESDRTQYDEKLRHYESCFQSSDDKRRIRVLEEDLRLAKESSVRLHAEVERAEERKIKHQEELDRAKNSVNEADNKRLCLQNELDSMKHEMLKLRDQLRFDGRQEVIKTGGVYKINLPDADSTAVAQLTKDLKDSVERENDLKEQLKFSEEENATMRKKLLDMEEETESMSLQLRKLSSAKSGRFTKGVKAVGGGGDQGLDSEAAATESELRLQMELAEQEVKVLKRKMDELQQDNDNLLCAIKYLRSKLEQRDGARSATPIGDSKSTRDLLTRLGAAAAEEEAAAAAGGGGSDGTKQQLVSSQKEVVSLKEKVEGLEKEKTRLADEIQKLKPAGGADPGTTPCVKGTSSGAVETEKNIVKTIEELEQLLMQEKEKVQLVTSEKQALISNLEKEKEELKTMSEMKTNMESLQKALSDLQAERDDPAKEKSKTSLSSGSAANGVLSKDKEPASWRWEKQELEKQVNELKKKLEDIQAAEKKKSPAKSKDNGTKVTDDSKDVAKLTEDCEGHKKQLEELTKKLAEVEEKLKKTENEKVKASKELEKAAATKDKTEVVSKSKDVGISFNDDSTSTEKKKLAKDLEEEKKRNEELAKERDTVIKEKESWTSERKKLVLERDAAINDREELAAKTRKDSEVKVSSPFGLRSKVGFGGKLTDAADSAKIKELTETLEKKEAELKALKVKAETKGPGERLGFQAKELSDLKKEKERLEQDLDKSASERKTLKADIQQLKDKLKSSEDTWNKERLRLEQDVKQVNDKTKPLAKTFRGSDDSSKQEKEALIKEKLKLIEDVTKLKKDLGEVDQKRTSEKESFEKALKEKTKALAETKTSCEGLHKEIERLNAQVAGSKSASSSASSKVVTIPVQSDRSAKTTIPIQKISSSSSSSSRSSPSNSSDDQDLHRTASLAAIEETYRSRTRTLEEELDGLRDQLTSVQKDSETQAVKSQKTFTELKANFDKELTSWNKERELLKKNGKLADEYGSKMTNLDKTVEELTGKLKAEEAKRRELEVKLLAQENAAKVDKTSTPTTEDKTKISEDKSATGPKSLEFRNRFEKFGGTPRPVRKMSLPSSTSTTPSSSDSGEKGGDWVGEIQRQMNEAEKARITDREELLEKMDRQKKDFELKLEAFKETTKMLDTKSQDLSTLEKKMAEVQCQMEEERSKWVKERSKLQSKLDNVQQKGREDKDKVAELTGEVKKLQLLMSSGRGATSLPSGSSTPLTPSTPMGSEKPNFRIKTSENPSAPKTHPTTSIVIPIRKIEDDRKKIPSSSSSSSSATADDGATSPAVATSNGVGKLSKKLFPFATDSQTSSNTSAKSYTPGQRTPIPINRINRSNPPKL